MYAKQYQSPFKPKVNNHSDTTNFDEYFTNETIKDTPMNGRMKTN